jgi:hypothetical protein
MWANIIERSSKGEGRIENQNYKWEAEAQRLLKEKENGNPKWVWQIDSSRTDDPESEVYYRLVRRSNTVKTIRTNFAPKVEIVSDVENILKLILDKNPKDFKTITDMTDQLAEMNVDDKQASVKKLKLIIRKQMYLSAEDKKKLEQYVGTFCNC